MGMGERGEKLVNFNSFLNLILSRLDESRASHLQLLFCFSVPLPQTHFALSYPALLSLSNLLSYISRPCLTQHLAKFQLLFPLDDLFSSVSWVITAIIQNMDSLGSSPAAHCFCPVSSSAFSPCTAVVPSFAWLWALSLSFCSRVMWASVRLPGSSSWLANRALKEGALSPSLQLPPDLPTA